MCLHLYPQRGFVVASAKVVVATAAIQVGEGALAAAVRVPLLMRALPCIVYYYVMLKTAIYSQSIRPVRLNGPETIVGSEKGRLRTVPSVVGILLGRDPE